ncbi:hypothetical protein K7X08_011780 [Anisodus acutangulus]|uniref:Uncharacterized protein n=1 Tax=Anisodus acutangulus TaxID=402998 RepID=A0A9Q1RLM3_9SOLA|nr:hypothetical protein K7X08_011780 [Anisodus acutangulus]
MEKRARNPSQKAVMAMESKARAPAQQRNRAEPVNQLNLGAVVTPIATSASTCGKIAHKRAEQGIVQTSVTRSESATLVQQVEKKLERGKKMKIGETNPWPDKGNKVDEQTRTQQPVEETHVGWVTPFNPKRITKQQAHGGPQKSVQ